MTHLTACAAMFHRQDVKRAKNVIVRSYNENQMIEGLRMDRRQRPFFDAEFPRSAALRHALRWTTDDQKETPYPAAAPLGKIESDTGDLGWYGADEKHGVVTIDTPNTQALIGYVRDGGRGTANMKAEVDNEFCCIYLTSLDGKPISSADRLLLTTTARATLSGFQWNADRKTVKNWGKAPTVIEPVRGAVVLKNVQHAKSMVVTPLAAEGRRLETSVKTEMTNVGLRVPVGEPITTWYLIEKPN
jgi:hypothetical protein